MSNYKWQSVDGVLIPLNEEDPRASEADAVDLKPVYVVTPRDEMKEMLLTLLSHHPPSQYGHCLRLSVFGRSIYFCGRCSGIYSGLGLGLIALTLLRVQLQPAWLWFFVALAMGLSTVVEWMTQRLTPRKTTVYQRFATGLLSGLGLAIIMILRDMVFMLVTLIVMMVSIGSVSLAEGRAGRRAEGNS